MTGDPEVDGLSSQLAEIENVDYTLEKTLTSMKIDLERIQAGWRGTLVCLLFSSSLLFLFRFLHFEIDLLPSRPHSTVGQKGTNERQKADWAGSK